MLKDRKGEKEKGWRNEVEILLIKNNASFLKKEETFLPVLYLRGLVDLDWGYASSVSSVSNLHLKLGSYFSY